MSLIILTLSTAGFLSWIIVFGLMVFGTVRAHFFHKRPPKHLDAPFALFPVSILKPLKGVDCDLEKNLRSFFLLDYPKYEILFSVASQKDPAWYVADKLITEYKGRTQVQARLICGAVEMGANPKVNNLVKSYESALFDWVLISDSNVRVRPDYLKRQIAHLEPQVGMLTCVVAGTKEKGLGGRLESVFLNTFYSRGMHLTDALGKTCVVGKSMLFQRSTAKRFGGIKTLALYLAEDFMAGEAMRKLGLKVMIAADPIEQVVGRMRLKDFWARHIRWGRIRKIQAPAAFFIEPLTTCLISGLIGALAFQHFFELPFYLGFLIHLVSWYLGDLFVTESVGGRLYPSHPLVWLLREALAFPLWLHIASGSTVQWRGKTLKILPGGLVELAK